VAVTQKANFRQWPLFSMKEDVTGRVLSSLYKNVKLSFDDDVVLFFITAFGKKEIQVLRQQFAEVPALLANPVCRVSEGNSILLVTTLFVVKERETESPL